VVIVIIGLLAGYVAPRYFSQIGKSESRWRRRRSSRSRRRWTSSGSTCAATPAPRKASRRWSPPGELRQLGGPYLKKDVPADPWGRPYIYRVPGQRGDFELFTYGRDGKSGGKEKTRTSAWARRAR